MRNPLMQLVGKTVVVTGAGSGVGFEAVRLLLQWKARVIAVDKEFPWDDDHWEDMPHGKVEPQPGAIIFDPLGYDLRDPNEAEGLWDKIKDREIYGLVNAAGVSFLDWTENIEYVDFMDTLEANVASAFLMIREFIRYSKSRPHDRFVVNVAPIPYSVAGAASEAAVEALTRQVADEQRGKIHLTCFKPGPLTGPSITTEHIIDRLVETRQEYEAEDHSVGVVKDLGYADQEFFGSIPKDKRTTCEDAAKTVIYALTDWVIPFSGTTLKCWMG